MKNKTAEDYLKEPYARILTPDEDGGFVAEILEFEGCFTEGKTAVEALENLDEVAKSWIELRLSKKTPIPEPMASYEMSGKFALRLPQSLHSKAAIMAERDGVSLNTFIVSAISMKVGAQDLFNRLLNELKSRFIQPATLVVPSQYSLSVSEFTQTSDSAITQKETALVRS